MKVKLLSRGRLLATSRTADYQAPPSAHKIIRISQSCSLAGGRCHPHLPLQSHGPCWHSLFLSTVPWGAALGDSALQCSPPLRLWVNVTDIFLPILNVDYLDFMFGYLILFRTGEPSYLMVKKFFFEYLISEKTGKEKKPIVQTERKLQNVIKCIQINDSKYKLIKYLF